MDKRRILLFVVALLFSFILAACAGPEGQAGPPGPPGPPGPEGPQGPAGEAGQDAQQPEPVEAAPQAASYVGAQTCAGCHTGTAEVFRTSSHPYILNRVVDGQAPEFPHGDEIMLPEGYEWGDISYVVGGGNWKARFLNKEGYIITGLPSGGGSADYANQFNLENETLELDAAFVPFLAGQEQVPYDCGQCHTTGYSPNGNQDDLPGITGSWAEPGVQCEACHGPGSLHIQNPPAVQMEIPRDRAFCAGCHVQGRSADISSDVGFILHHEQYGGMFLGKHETLDCIVCHDPHSGAAAVALGDENAPAGRAACEDCHFLEAQFQAVQTHQRLGVTCVTCHMAPNIVNAWGVPEKYLGDVSTHVMSINPFQVSALNEDGSPALAQIALNFSCRQCHNGTRGTEKTDEILIDAATDYHARPETP